ncbi:MAG: carboxyl transferase domain-containing protein, partial [Acholeplasma sp.]|nr:carboxyl transferase domain-containing protein [Acholeplasma sp.]
MSAWDKVLLARNQNRPTAKQLIDFIFTDFIELHGDRLIGDDKAIIGGVGCLDGIPVTVIAHEKGVTTEEKIKRNFGMPHPEGYHKALRLMKQAEKFKRPIITIIDTPGAYPGIAAEQRGQAHAIAQNIQEMI